MRAGRVPEQSPADGLPATEPHPPPDEGDSRSWEGRRLAGRYVLGPRLGVGGMGLVLRAHDDVLRREVAVKLLAGNLAADPHARERFLREARAAARISHPRTVAVYDVGDEDGRPYLVLELVEGPSLAEIVAQHGPLDPHEVATITADALAALASAHDAGVLHRDVKPGNLLRNGAGRTKLADFGVAEAVDVPGITRTGLIMGTHSYLAPERRRGADATVASDLWALGATLAELLTGRPPRTAADLELPPHVPPGLRRLVERLLAEDPDDRPRSAGAARALLDGRTEATQPTAEVNWLAPRRAGHTTGWRVLVAIAGLAVGLAVWQVTDVSTASSEADRPGEGVERSADPAETARSLAEWLRERGGDR